MEKEQFSKKKGCIDCLFDFLSRKIDGKVTATDTFFAKAGLFGFWVIAGLSVLLGVVLVRRYAMPAVSGVMFASISLLWCVFLHYVAATMLPSLNRLIANAPTRMSSESVLRVVALFVGLSGIGALLYGIYSAFVAFNPALMGSMAIQSSNISFICLFLFVFCEFWFFLLLRPADLNVQIVEKTSVGEEFIGLTSFFAKGCLKLTPVVFGISIVFAILQMIVMLFDSNDLFGQMQTVIYLCLSALLPLLIYIAFLSYYFTLDVLTAILKIPEKLAEIVEKK